MSDVTSPHDNAPTISDLDCLVIWPPGSEQERAERRLVSALRDLCREFGFGRVPQVATQIEIIWRDHEAQGTYQKIKTEHLRWMDENPG